METTRGMKIYQELGMLAAWQPRGIWEDVREARIEAVLAEFTDSELELLPESTGAVLALRGVFDPGVNVPVRLPVTVRVIATLQAPGYRIGVTPEADIAALNDEIVAGNVNNIMLHGGSDAYTLEELHDMAAETAQENGELVDEESFLDGIHNAIEQWLASPAIGGGE